MYNKLNLAYQFLETYLKNSKKFDISISEDFNNEYVSTISIFDKKYGDDDISVELKVKYSYTFKTVDRNLDTEEEIGILTDIDIIYFAFFDNEGERTIFKSIDDTPLYDIAIKAVVPIIMEEYDLLKNNIL